MSVDVRPLERPDSSASRSALDDDNQSAVQLPESGFVASDPIPQSGTSRPLGRQYRFLVDVSTVDIVKLEIRLLEEH